MMIRIVTNVFEIVVFATCTNAFLSVDSTLQRGKFARRIYCLQEDGLELVHSLTR
jgi:hypothetical protein